jgi:hypothetical protein
MTAIGSKTPCGRCSTPSTVYGTVFYVEKLIERYFSALREIKALQQPETADSQEEQAAEQQPVNTPHALLNEDLHNTTLLATAQQHAPLAKWFSSRQIDAKFDHQLVDTSGFFDDAARMIGERYDLYGELMDRVRFAYRKSHSWINIDLSNMSQKDAQAVNTLSRQLYSHTFFARYSYQKPEKNLGLTLQTAPAVRQFFDGGWLEWYVFIELLNQFKASGRHFSCGRGVKVIFPNEDLHELDVVFLPEGQSPVCIECKSGEFRRDIDKYLRLRKRLGLERSRFVVCAADLTDEQAAGLSAMYELTFVNLNSLQRHLQTLV